MDTLRVSFTQSFAMHVCSQPAHVVKTATLITCVITVAVCVDAGSNGMVITRRLLLLCAPQLHASRQDKLHVCLSRQLHVAHGKWALQNSCKPRRTPPSLDSLTLESISWL